MNKRNPKAMGSIDVEKLRDFWNETGPTDIEVFEDVRIKNRAIGFVWDEPKRIVVVEK